MPEELGEPDCIDPECSCPSPASQGGSVEFEDHRLDSTQQAVRAAAFRILLDTGQPVATRSVAIAGEVDLAVVNEVLQGFARTGNVAIDNDEVVGIAGLSVEPTRHRIELEAGRRWTWCALDAVGIVGAVGDGVIHSETTNGQVELRVDDGELEPNDLAVFVPEGYGMTSAADQWCPLVNFFPTVASAAGWAEESGVSGKAISLSTVAPGLVDRWRSVLNHQSE